MKRFRKLTSLLLTAALFTSAVGTLPSAAPVSAEEEHPSFNFNFSGGVDAAFQQHAGFEVIAFPDAGWMALNNISDKVVPHLSARNVTVEVDYYWENMTGSSWLMCRTNTEAGTDSTSVNFSINSSSIVQNKWTTWKFEARDCWFGSRQDSTDLFFTFGGGGGSCHIRSIKVYQTASPENYAAWGPKAVAAPGEVDYPFQDVSLSFEERAADLVSRMTLEEKLTQLGSNNPAVSRLGVRAYNYWRECLHGVARIHEDGRVQQSGKTGATSYPYSIAMGATWNPELIRQIGSATSDEARAFDNAYKTGLNYFSPTINLDRDPRWGRSHETYSEDTFLTSLIGAGFVKGMEGDDPVYRKASATIKHYALNNSEFNRENGNSAADNRTVLELYTRAYKYISLTTGVGSVMSSYNRVNGVPASANRYLLTDLLRQRWGFDGFFVSDCGAVTDIFDASRHHWKPTKEELEKAAVSYRYIQPYLDNNGYVTPAGGVALALLAGLDLNCGPAYGNYMGQALAQGLITEGELDRALVRFFTMRFATGEFDPEEMVPYRSAEYSVDNQQESPAHRQLAEDSADEAIVLLKNADGTLPLNARDLKNVVLIGENVNQVVLGDYSGEPSKEYSSTPAEGVGNLLKSLSRTANLTVIDTYNTSSSKYFGNIGYVKLTYKNGSTLTLQPKDSTIQDSCRVESDTNFGYVYGGGYAGFPNVNTKDIAKVEITTSGNANDCTHGKVEVHLNAPTGMKLCEVTSAPTSGWGDYQVRTATEIGSNGGYDNTTLYITFNGGSSFTMSSQHETAIKNADVVIASVGTFNGDSSEGNDRSTFSLPRNQAALVNQVADWNSNVVVFIQAVNVVDIESFRQRPEVKSILWTCYNGQAQGNAMARTLFGQVNPSARLPFTWYTSATQLAPLTDYTIRGTEESLGRTYQYFRGDVTYPFGYGLSYTDFELSDIALDKTAVTPDDVLTLTLKVKNTGSADGAQVVQAYAVSPGADGKERPFKELKGFQKVFLKAGETKEVTVELPVIDWYFADEETGVQQYDQGEWTVEVGVSSQDIAKAFPVTLSGALTQALRNVEMQPDAVVLYDDAANGPTGMDSHLTVALNDDSMLAPNAAGLTVKYESSSPAFTVDKNGRVTALSGGVGRVTATVTYRDKTLTASYPVVVKGTARFTQGSLTDRNYTVTGSVPVGGALRVRELPDGDFFRSLMRGSLRQSDGTVPPFTPIGFDLVWNYDTMPAADYQMTVILPRGAALTGILAIDGMNGDTTRPAYDLTDGVLTLTANSGCYYALIGTGLSVEEPAALPGDVDGDGEITSTDARLTLQIAVDKIRASDVKIPAAADVDGDKSITSTDARLILQKSVGKIGKFPIE